MDAAKFARIVTALATRFEAGHEAGVEWSFMVGEAYDVHAWAAGSDTLVLQLFDVTHDVEGRAVRTVTVCPGEHRTYEVVAGNRLVIDETRGGEAAFSAALDYLTEPMRAAAQHEHDMCAV